MGIYGSENEASAALWLRTTQRPFVLQRTVGDKHFFSAHGFHLRIKNLVGELLLSEDWIDSKDPSQANTQESEHMEETAVNMEAALRDPSIIRYGTVVAVAKLTVDEVARVTATDRDLSDYWSIVVSTNPEEKVIFPAHQESTIYMLGLGRFELIIDRESRDSELTLRLVKPTGEVLVKPMGDLLRDVTKTVIHPLERAEPLAKLRP
jgi:hypothetical protein